MKTARLVLLAPLATAGLLAACSLVPREAPLPATLAFPPGPARPPPSAVRLPPLVLFPVTAPAWLDGRLLYVRRPGSLRLVPRRSAVWIAPLPTFLTTSLRETLLPLEAPGEARLALHVHLFDLEEIRSRPRRVVLVARARLVSVLRGVRNRVRLWRLSTRAAAGARGEARAVVALDRRLDRDVRDWLVRVAPAGAAHAPATSLGPAGGRPRRLSPAKRDARGPYR